MELPVITTGLKIGRIHLDSNRVEVFASISYTCAISAVCCSTLRIPVTSFDVERIMEHGYEMDQIIGSMSPIRLPSKTLSGRTEKVYLLKKKPFENSCTFLDNNLCSIHEFKPYTCRIYPFTLQVIDEYTLDVLIHTDKLCSSVLPAEGEAETHKILENLIKEINHELTVREKV